MWYVVFSNVEQSSNVTKYFTQTSCSNTGTETYPRCTVHETFVEERDEILDKLKTTVSNEVSFRISCKSCSRTWCGRYSDALNTFEEDNDKSNLEESLEHIMELMCAKKREEQEVQNEKEQIELEALMRQCWWNVLTLPVGQHFDVLWTKTILPWHHTDCKVTKTRVIFTTPCYVSVDVQWRIVHRFNNKITQHIVLSIVSTLDLSPHSEIWRRY